MNNFFSLHNNYLNESENLLFGYKFIQYLHERNEAKLGIKLYLCKKKNKNNYLIKFNLNKSTFLW